MANFDSAGYKAALVARGVSSEEADARVAAYLSSPQARADSASFQSTQGPQPGAMRSAAPSEQTRAGVQAPEQGYGGLVEPALSLLPLAGGAAMGALGAPLGPAGMAAGAGLGAAGGEAGRQLIARALGLPAPATAGDAAQKIGFESLMGGAGTYIPAKAMELASPAIAGAASRLPKFLARRIPFLRDAADLGELMGGSGSAASRTAEAAAPAAGPAAAASVEGAAPPGMKAATDYWRRRAFAIMEQAKVPADAEAQRAAMSEALGRNVSTRSGLSIEDWIKVHDAMGERIAQNAAKEAGEKAAASAARRGVRTANKAAREAAKAGKPALQVVEGGAPVTSGSGEPERVVKAAVLGEDGKFYTGAHHGEAMEAARAAGTKASETQQDLFLTSRGRYINRSQSIKEFGTGDSQGLYRGDARARVDARRAEARAAMSAEPPRPTPAKLAAGLKGEPGYAYHATNEDRLQEIADSGALDPHDPSYGTDQSAWPDGKGGKRSYFVGADKAGHAWQFAPEEGKPVVLRVKDAGLGRESGTGDLFTSKKIPASQIEYLSEDGSWQPLKPGAGDGKAALAGGKKAGQGPAKGSAASRARGASAPELARRTTARGAAIGREATTEAPGQLEEALRRSLEAEHQMDAMGLTPEQRGIARRLLRGQ